ncbi:MAG: glycosyltransferase family 2 protein, partial [Candidatus Bipolaricaulia bacterium]
TNKISVVIPAYNEEDWIELPLKSLQNQNYDEEFEIIVVDKNSEDNTQKISKDYGARVINEPEGGVSQARQIGFKSARYPIIASTDADTVVPENWLKTINKTFQDPEVVGTYGSCTFYDSSFFYNLLAKYGFSGFLRLNSCVGKPLFIGFNMAVSKEAFDETRGFDSSIKSAEDVDLSQRVKKQGKIIYNKDLTVKTSVRRLEDWGLSKFLIHHAINYFNVVWLRRPDKARDFDDIR